jgi:hypothetical protein
LLTASKSFAPAKIQPIIAGASRRTSVANLRK